jgi:hypothetical protein
MTNVNTNTTLDTRHENFTQAYLEMGHEPEVAAELGAQRTIEDNDALFQVYGCTNYITAKETVWLIEAATLLCCGDLYHAAALELIDKARRGISKK